MSPGSDAMSSASTVFITAIQQMTTDMTTKVQEALDKFSNAQGDIIVCKDGLIRDLKLELAELKK